MKWRNKTLEEVREFAAEGKSPEFSHKFAVMPWVPEDISQWHPDPIESMKQSYVHRQLPYSQDDLDYASVSVRALRVMVDDMGLTRLPDKDSQ
ncbi:MAG: hypothetical protein GY768_29590 [Planctomycetaceae bacterium]|nr:hypothetical protein [Planctomycetaceae bacterium]